MLLTETSLRRIIRKSLLNYANESKAKKYIRSLLNEDIAVGDDFDEDAYNKEQSAQLEKIYKQIDNHWVVIHVEGMSKKDPQSMYKMGKTIHKFLRLLKKFEGSDEEIDSIVKASKDKKYQNNLRKVRKIKASDVGGSNLMVRGQLFKALEKLVKMIKTNDYIEEIFTDANDFMQATKDFAKADKKKSEDPFT